MDLAVAGGTSASKTFTEPVAPGASVSATFKVTSGPAAFNGDLVGNASWTTASGQTQSETTVEKVRNVSPIKINEFRDQRRFSGQLDRLVHRTLQRRRQRKWTSPTGP